MTDKKLRVFKLRNVGDEELLKGLEEYKKELNNLRTLKITGGTSAKLGKIRVCIMNIFTPLQSYLCLLYVLSPCRLFGLNYDSFWPKR